MSTQCAHEEHSKTAVTISVRERIAGRKQAKFWTCHGCGALWSGSEWYVREPAR